MRHALIVYLVMLAITLLLGIFIDHQWFGGSAFMMGWIAMDIHSKGTS